MTERRLKNINFFIQRLQTFFFVTFFYVFNVFCFFFWNVFLHLWFRLLNRHHTAVGR